VARPCADGHLPPAPADGRAPHFLDRDQREPATSLSRAERNDAWLHVRVAALNLRRLLALGLGYDSSWVLASA
jgi:hypothetical protein